MALNLVQHRGEPNVWDRVGGRTEWDIERWMAAVMGGAFVVAGFRRRSWRGLVLVLGGGALGWWAAAGADQRSVRRGRLRAVLPLRRNATDEVIEASEASFPASDPPSWTATTGNTGPAPDRQTR